MIFVYFIIAVVLDYIVGTFTHNALLTTSLSPLATNILTVATSVVFFIAEIVAIFSLGGRK